MRLKKQQETKHVTPSVSLNNKAFLKEAGKTAPLIIALKITLKHLGNKFSWGGGITSKLKITNH